MPGVLNPGGILGWWHVAGYFLGWYGDAFDIVFGQHSAESTVCSLSAW